MGAALWADVVAAGLGGGSVRKPSKSGHSVERPAKGCSGALGTGQGEGAAE